MPADLFAITTPLYYVNGRPHIGHTYSTCLADTLARYHRQRGAEVFFVTGSDEHGQKVAGIAEKHGMTPLAWADGIVEYTQELWKVFGFTYDRYVRTTEPQHYADVQMIVEAIKTKGDIYLDKYEGWYSVSEERFVPEGEKENYPPGDCVWTSEETFYFRLSAYQQTLLDLYEREPERIRPDSRRNEILSRLNGEPLRDLSITRTALEWGVPLPNLAPGHVCYVWFDALLGYATACGLQTDRPNFDRVWPRVIHLIGKDILWFHTVIWPAMQLAAGLPLSAGTIAHGFWIKDEQKISKSLGNLIQPEPFIAEFGPDAFRYYLLREASLGNDGSFSDNSFIHRINSDLANDLGNALHRSLSMLGRYREGVVPARPEKDSSTAVVELREAFERAMHQGDAELEQFRLNSALEILWEAVRALNKYIDTRAPWQQAKTEQTSMLEATLYDMVDGLRMLAIALSPYIPNLAQQMWVQLGFPGEVAAQPRVNSRTWGLTPAGHRTAAGDPIVPRIDEAEYFAKLSAEQGAPAAVAKPAPAKGIPAAKPPIQYDDFARMDLRVGKIIAAEKMENADKLLKLQVEMGDHQRTIVSGIAEHYAPEAVLGRTIIVLANLAPRKLRGVESQGMLLATTTAEGKVILLEPEIDAPPGSPVS